MPRAKSFTRPEIAKAVLPHFWDRGFGGVSMDDIVTLTGISRHALYAEVGGKHDLYLSAFEEYQQSVVSPAFQAVETDGGLLAIRAYFEHQIARAEEMGLPGPGCLVGNAAIERAPHDEAITALVDTHNKRLTKGFVHALNQCEDNTLTPGERQHLAHYLTISAQGLWSVSRTTKTSAPLYAFVETLMDLIEIRIRR
ncbi:MAG: TetR/AcrR family transcriptional regulator [Pseudomonadota bacterium]